MNSMIFESMEKLYPSMATAQKLGDTYTAYDTSRNPLVINMSAVNQEAKRLQSEAQAQAEAKAQLRTSVINKIAINLTSEEKAWLEENL